MKEVEAFCIGNRVRNVLVQALFYFLSEGLQSAISFQSQASLVSHSQTLDGLLSARGWLREAKANHASQ